MPAVPRANDRLSGSAQTMTTDKGVAVASNEAPLVSIIINNFNYARFLPEAIESALHQTYAPIEVLVVDDGSTDASREVITHYSSQLVPILKENGGQASAFNAGFAASHGEIVLFLDADDLLAPDIVTPVVQAFQRDTAATKVHFRLAIVDAAGQPTGDIKPPLPVPLRTGDLRLQVLTFPDDIPWLPTSGNAFLAASLREILPMPESSYRICADYYLSNIPPLLGTVAAVDEVGGYYRVHGGNNHANAGLDIAQVRQIIRQTYTTHTHINAFVVARDLGAFPNDPAAVRSVTFFAHRLVSLKLDPANHPLPQDTTRGLVLRGVQAAAGRFDIGPAGRAAYAAWFVSMLFAPRSVARWLAEQFFYPERRLPLRRGLQRNVARFRALRPKQPPYNIS